MQEHASVVKSSLGSELGAPPTVPLVSRTVSHMCVPCVCHCVSGTMRGKFVPEEVRSTIMNIFRIGLNLIVVVVLWNVRGPLPALTHACTRPCPRPHCLTGQPTACVCVLYTCSS